jgi:phage baseplate assembly protein gpV
MERFLNALKAQAGALVEGQAQPRFGLVTSVDPTSATARVNLQPEGVLTGWLPILSPWTGAEWGIACPPSPGDQVLVLAQEGDAEHGLIIGRAFSATQQAPPAPAGEFWLVHSTGSSLKLQNDGTVHINGPVSISGTVTVTGDLHATGNVYDQHNSLAGLRAHYNMHTHLDSRSSTTSGPNQQD